MRHALPWLLVALVALTATSLADVPQAPSVADPFPFDHDVHGTAFDKAGVTCITCHPVGLRVPTDDGTRPPEAATPPSHATCHACHLREVPGATRKAPRTCETCHPVRAELVPPDHGHDWTHQHGLAARADMAGCRSCHEPTRCIACHEERGPVVRNPHPPGFARTHGVEARLDPMGCTSCHTGDACTSCHIQGAPPW